MSKSHRSSHASETCRLEWRPSRLLAGALVLLGVLAAASVLASEVPAPVAWPLAMAAVLHGTRMAGLHLRTAGRELVWNGHAELVRLDGVAVARPRLLWRGPVAVLSWQPSDGRRQRLAWWPDTLPAARRRELRLAAGQGDGRATAARMAT